MFEAGKKYEFVFLASTEDGPTEIGGQRWWVKEVEGALLHLHSPALSPTAADEFLGVSHEKNMILNTASPFFHSARLTDEIDAEDKRREDLADRWRTGKQRR